MQVYERALRLDGPTLANLELLENSEGGAEGSLLARLDSCHSAGIPLPTAINSLTLLQSLKAFLHHFGKNCISN